MIGSGVLNASVTETLMTTGIENVTQIDVSEISLGGSGDDWINDYTSTKGGGWIFNNAQVNKTGNISLKGVSFVNSNITAGDNLTLHNDNTSLTVSNSNLTATSGDISLSGHNPSSGQVTGVNLANVQLNASRGDITVNGTTPGIWSGVIFNNVTMLADRDAGDINVYAESRGKGDTYDEKGSLRFIGTDSFSAANMNFTGVNKRTGAGAYNEAGLAFDIGSNMSFSGNTTINASGGKGVAVWQNTELKFIDGTSAINAKATVDGGDDYFGQGAIFFNHLSGKVEVGIVVNNGSLNITASSKDLKNVTAFNMGELGTTSSDGVIFSGNGDVTITGKSNGSTGLSSHMFNNEHLSGHLTINGESETGTGILIQKTATSNLVNATINGVSQSGTGIRISAENGSTNL
ncbi:hypothetical protein CB225_24555, partial [Salmonella enterica subsp. enterica serovar Newport]|nr:hypothetical protein [Salmonella enterica subsp. enterica serovar Newport]